MFLPLEKTNIPMGNRFNNAGFEFKSLILNSADIVFLYLLTLVNFFVFKLLQKVFYKWTRGKRFA